MDRYHPMDSDNSVVYIAKKERVMDLMNKIGMIMCVGGMLVTVLGVIVQILAMALEEIW